MSNVLAKQIVGKAGRTYSAILGSRTGAIIKKVIARQTVGADYDGTRTAWSSATIQMQDFVDGLLGTNLRTMALENKIASQCEVNKSGHSYALRLGSRNGAVISGVNAKVRIEADNV